MMGVLVVMVMVFDLALGSLDLFTRVGGVSHTYFCQTSMTKNINMSSPSCGLLIPQSCV